MLKNKDYLEHSNSVLRGCLTGQNDEDIELRIDANEEQIRILTESFYIN